MGQPYVKKAGEKKYRELRDKGYTKGDAAEAANAVSQPVKSKVKPKQRKAAKKRTKK